MRHFKELEKITNEFQAVVIRIPREDFDAMLQLEREMEELLAPTDFAYHDGNEIGGGETTLWEIGTDAEKLFRHIEHTLRASAFAAGCHITLRFGNPGAPERTFAFA